MGSLLLVNKANTWRKEGGQRKECVSVRRLGCRHHTPWQSIEEEDGRSARERERERIDARRDPVICHSLHFTFFFIPFILLIYHAPFCHLPFAKLYPAQRRSCDFPQTSPLDRHKQQLQLCLKFVKRPAEVSKQGQLLYMVSDNLTERVRCLTTQPLSMEWRTNRL